MSSGRAAIPPVEAAADALNPIEMPKQAAEEIAAGEGEGDGAVEGGEGIPADAGADLEQEEAAEDEADEGEEDADAGEAAAAGAGQQDDAEEAEEDYDQVEGAAAGDTAAAEEDENARPEGGVEAAPGSGNPALPAVFPGLHDDELLRENFKCPITQKIMLDPVTIEGGQGHTYERTAIQDWLNTGHRTDPVTGKPLPQITVLVPNHLLRNVIETYFASRPGLRAALFHHEDVEEQKVLEQLRRPAAQAAAGDDEDPFVPRGNVAEQKAMFAQIAEEQAEAKAIRAADEAALEEDPALQMVLLQDAAEPAPREEVKDDNLPHNAAEEKQAAIARVTARGRNAPVINSAADLQHNRAIFWGGDATERKYHPNDFIPPNFPYAKYNRIAFGSNAGWPELQEWLEPNIPIRILCLVIKSDNMALPENDPEFLGKSSYAFTGYSGYKFEVYTLACSLVEINDPTNFAKGLGAAVLLIFNPYIKSTYLTQRAGLEPRFIGAHWDRERPGAIYTSRERIGISWKSEGLRVDALYDPSKWTFMLSSNAIIEQLALSTISTPGGSPLSNKPDIQTPAQVVDRIRTINVERIISFTEGQCVIEHPRLLTLEQRNDFAEYIPQLRRALEFNLFRAADGLGSALDEYERNILAYGHQLRSRAPVAVAASAAAVSNLQAGMWGGAAAPNAPLPPYRQLQAPPPPSPSAAAGQDELREPLLNRDDVAGLSRWWVEPEERPESGSRCCC